MLDKLAKHHNEWVKIAEIYNANHYAEDIVQEMYIKIVPHIDKCFNGEKLNKSYIYLTIKNLCLDLHRKKVHKVQIVDDILEDTFEIEEPKDVVNEVLKNVHWYDKELFELYLLTGSCRKLEKLTDINYMSIYRSVCRVKRKLKRKAKDLETQSKR